MINLTKLSKALQGHKGLVMWFKKDGYNFIGCGFFLLATKQEITGSALSKLLTFLGNTPVDGQGYQVLGANKTEMDQTAMDNMLRMLEYGATYKAITDTGLMADMVGRVIRIYHTGEDYLFLDKVYADLIDPKADGLRIISDKPTSPVYFTAGDDTALLLPVRYPNPDLPYLKEGKGV